MSEYTYRVAIGNDDGKTLQEVIDDSSIPAARRALAVICLKKWTEGMAAIGAGTYKPVGDKGEPLDLTTGGDIRRMWLWKAVDQIWFSKKTISDVVTHPEPTTSPQAASASPSIASSDAPEDVELFVD
jgi:hypothetical protein